MKKERKRFYEIFNNANDAMFLYNITDDNMPGEFIEVNDVACSMLGYSREELLNMTPKDINCSVDDDKVPEIMNKLIEDGGSKFEMVHISKEGKGIPVETNCHVFDLEGEKKVLSIARDITQRKRMVRDLKESEKKYKTIFRTAKDGIFIIKDSEFIDCNEKIGEIFGCSKEEFIGKKPFELSPERQPDGSKSIRKGMKKLNLALEGKPQTFEWEHITLDGETFPAEITLNKLEVNDEKFLMGIVRDITERKKKERKLLESKERFKKLFNNFPEPSVLVDSSNNVVDVNFRFEEVFGYERKEIIGENIDQYVVPERLMKEAERLNERNREGYVKYETIRKGKRGEFPVAISSIPFEIDNETHIIASYENIEERKNAEKKEELLHKLLRHDLRNKTQVVKGYLNLLEGCDLTKEAENYFEEAKTGIENSERIIENVRTLRKAEQEEIKDIKIQEIIEEAVKQTKEDINQKNITLNYEKPKNVKIIGGSLLIRALYNIIENSIQHSKATKIKITCEHKKQKIICIIEDNGKGIPDKKKKHIFKKGTQQTKKEEQD